MVEYQNLSLESKNNYKNSESTNSLLKLLSMYNKNFTKQKLELLVKNSIKTSNNPVLFLRTIEKALK